MKFIAKGSFYKFHIINDHLCEILCKIICVASQYMLLGGGGGRLCFLFQMD